MKRKALVYAHCKLYPAQSGFNRRALEMIGGLQELGFEVTLASTTMREGRWGNTADQNGDWIDHLKIYQLRKRDRIFIRGMGQLYKRFNHGVPSLLQLESTPFMRMWFNKIVNELSPDLIFMNYVFSDAIISQFQTRNIAKVMDSIDLYTLNKKMWAAVEKCLPATPVHIEDVETHVLEEDFYSKLNLSTTDEEFKIYDRYNHTIAITKQEQQIIQQHTHKTCTSHIGVTQSPYYLENDYSGPAFLPTGPNPYNLQGLLYFMKRILPRVRSYNPEFNLMVSGSCCEWVHPVEGIELKGFIPDISSVYQTCSFLVCPIFGGTGQQVKIVEAMAHGVPVIALRGTAERSPIIHNVNGMIANNAEEFAAHVSTLWNDRKLCQQLGTVARETIRTECSREHLVASLSAMINS